MQCRRRQRPGHINPWHINMKHINMNGLGWVAAAPC
jgi:hypothetical protein